jgi:putative transposase
VLRPPVESGQYTSLRFTQRLADAGIAPSTGSVGDSFDNAVAESFFGTLKTELIYRHTWASRHDAELAIFAWIEGWYNPERLIAALGMHSPNEYEAAFYADHQHRQGVRRSSDDATMIDATEG